MEPDNTVEKYAACVKKNYAIVGHGKNGRFAKMIFYFPGVDKYAKCKVIITRKKVNLGDGEGMQLPCLLKISGTKIMLQILCKKYSKLLEYRNLPFLPITQPTVWCFEFCNTQYLSEFSLFLWHHLWNFVVSFVLKLVVYSSYLLFHGFHNVYLFLKSWFPFFFSNGAVNLCFVGHRVLLWNLYLTSHFLWHPILQALHF